MLTINADDQISPTKVFRTESKPLTPNVVPSGGTIHRCPHGVYIPAGEVTAPYCSYCSPGGPANQRDVVLPRSSADPLNAADRVYANKHVSGSCPQCGSTVYMRKDEKGTDANRICADCGTPYRARVFKSFKQLAQDVGVSFDE
jgi:predicted RNA-binding Zn-ribbon protein involved in translation (DUF1610 family)